MSTERSFIIIISILYWFNAPSSLALLETPMAVGDTADNDVFQILNTKDYLPDDFPKSPVQKSVDNDATYILSKLSDEELIKLLNQQPKQNEYDLNDVVKISNTNEVNAFHAYDNPISGDEKRTDRAFFKLDHKEVEPFNSNNGEDPKFSALVKLNNLLYSRPQLGNSEEDDEKKEMIFDVLIAQLKALCCKRSKPRTNTNLYKLKSLLKKVILQKGSVLPENISQNKENPREHIFLIINDEIRSNVSEELIAVDPDSLSKNSSVLLLGPITTPLSDIQLKLVMTRIANELSKPEYLPLIKKISEGILDDSNIGLMKSIISGPDSRRYIKPHRCNHQSKLAKVYGGLKWIICTGYLNINTPSLYD